jgi:hypothetical protein
VGRFFEGLAIPMGELSAGFVGGLTKVEERGAGRWGAANIVIHENELVELRVVPGGVRAHARFAEAWWLGSHVVIEGWPFEAAAGPKADAADLVGIGFAGDGIGAGAFRGGATGKTGDGMVEATPEKVHGAGLAEEAGAELLENAIHGDEDLPEPARIFGIVRGVDAILVKGNGVGDFHWHFPNLDLDARRAKHAHKGLIKIGHRAGEERERFDLAVVGLQHEFVIEEIEAQFEGAPRVGNCRGGQAARADIERHIPPVIQPGSKSEANFADDLRPHVEGGVGILPRCEWEGRPAVWQVAHDGFGGFIPVEHVERSRSITASQSEAWASEE